MLLHNAVYKTYREVPGIRNNSGRPVGKQKGAEKESRPFSLDCENLLLRLRGGRKNTVQAQVDGLFAVVIGPGAGED
jgi:hypothetical protein